MTFADLTSTENRATFGTGVVVGSIGGAATMGIINHMSNKKKAKNAEETNVSQVEKATPRRITSGKGDV